MSKKKIGKYDIVGQKIVEFLPYHDGAEIVLENGLTFDGGFDGKVEESKHPDLVRIIGNLQLKEGDMTDKVKKKMDELIGQNYRFNKKPCKVLKIADYDLGKIKIKYQGKERVIDIYSLE